MQCTFPGYAQFSTTAAPGMFGAGVKQVWSYCETCLVPMVSRMFGASVKHI